MMRMTGKLPDKPYMMLQISNSTLGRKYLRKALIYARVTRITNNFRTVGEKQAQETYT